MKIVRVFMDSKTTAIYLDGKLARYDIYVRSAWLIGSFEKLGIIPYGELINKVVYKYGDFTKIPNSHDFIQNDLVTDSVFKIENADIKSIYVNKKSTQMPKQFKTLQKLLKNKYNIDFE